MLTLYHQFLHMIYCLEDQFFFIPQKFLFIVNNYRIIKNISAVLEQNISYFVFLSTILCDDFCYFTGSLKRIIETKKY